MNRISNFLFILLFIVFNLCTASATTHREEFKGYMITLKNDTVPVVFSLPLTDDGSPDMFRMGNFVKIILSDGKKKTISPEQVLGYSFKEYSLWHHFVSYQLNERLEDGVSKDTSDSNYELTAFSEIKFLRRITRGTATLYVYERKQNYSSYNGGMPGMSGTMNYSQTSVSTYYIEKNDVLYHIPKIGFKDKILQVLPEDSDLVTKISKEYKYKDIETIVREYNRTFR